MKLKHQVNVSYNNIANNTLHIKIEGVYIQNIAPEAKDFLDNIEKSNCNKILLDYSNCKVVFNVHSTINKHENVRNIYNFGVKKIAGIFPEIDDNISFFENFFSNRGFNIKAFSNMYDALEWLEK